MINLARLVLTCLCFALVSHTATAESFDVLGPGDGVRVTVFQHPNLSAETRISGRGTVSMPLIGEINVKGLSQNQAAARIAAAFKQGMFLNDPQVSVVLTQVRSRQVSVLGQVARPGRYVLEDSARLTDVLAMAGGIAAEGDKMVTLVSMANGQPTKRDIDITRVYREGDPQSNIELKNGDTVIVERSPVFYIYGQVNRAGAYRLVDNLNVMQAVSLAGGVAPRGTERGVKIRRTTPEGVKDIGVKMSDVVQANDVIYIQESFF